jgi:pyruvate kinase
MDVARLNASHGDHAFHGSTLRAVRRLAREEGRNVAVLLDLQGPKVRVGLLPEDPLRLRPGDTIFLGGGGKDAVPVSHRGLARDVRPGDHLVLDEGRLRLEVERVERGVIRCRVRRGGPLRSRKGINVPGRRLSISSLTAKDRRDVAWGVGRGVDWIALSFVRDAMDVTSLRRLLARRGAAVPIMAKIETAEAVSHFEEILAASDGVMVARGDLGVELPAEELPALQKRWVHTARRAGKPVVIATQMLESMVANPIPTRAEVSDVANAVFDDADAVMLSGETAAGEYPLEAARAMHRIVLAAERARAAGACLSSWGPPPAQASIPEAVGKTAADAAAELGARAIVVYTKSGGSAHYVAKHRPLVPLFAFTSAPDTGRRLALLWGVEVRTVERRRDMDDLVDTAVTRLREERRVRRGDLVVVKTRLVPPLTPREAADLYAALLGDAAEALASGGPSLPWAWSVFSTDPARQEATWPTGAPRPPTWRAQEGPDLGARLATAFRQLLDGGARAAVIAGSDHPTLSADLVEGAFLALDDADLVLGPCPDGGYYLVGLRAPCADLFRDIPWSTSGVLPRTRERAAAAGLSTVLLAPGPDVDRPEDLPAVRRRLDALAAEGSVAGRRTRSLLAALTALSGD